jgi:hypothetical protein
METTSPAPSRRNKAATPNFAPEYTPAHQNKKTGQTDQTA